MKPVWIKILLCIAIAGLAFGVYWQTGAHEFVNFDDQIYLTDNPAVQRGLNIDGVKWAFATYQAANWHPVTWISHMADVSMFGMDPGKHHLMGVALHAINAILLFLLIEMLTGCAWRAGFVAAVFAVHPLHVESVAWASERKDVLSTLFWLLTTFGYIWWLRSRSLWKYALTAAAFAIGLMAKPMLVTLPVTLLILDFWPLRRVAARGTVQAASGREDSSVCALACRLSIDIYRPAIERREEPFRRLLIEKIPLFALSLAACVSTYVAQQSSGAVGTIEKLPLGVRLANAAVTGVEYLMKTFIPTRLSAFYPHPENSIPLLQIIACAALLALIMCWAVAVRKRRPYVFAGWMWYIVTLIPVIGIVQVGMQAMADRYMYVPMIGVLIMIAWGAADILRGRLAAIAGVIAVAALSAMCWKQAGVWKDSETLWRHAINVTQRNSVAYFNLGSALTDKAYASSDKEMLREALGYLEKAIEIEPRSARARTNAAAIYYEMGDIAKAEELLNEAVRLDPSDANAQSNLGFIFLETNRFSAALQSFDAAIAQQPDVGKSFFGRANARFNLGDYRGALDDLQQAAKYGYDVPRAAVEQVESKLR